MTWCRTQSVGIYPPFWIFRVLSITFAIWLNASFEENLPKHSRYERTLPNRTCRTRRWGRWTRRPTRRRPSSAPPGATARRWEGELNRWGGEKGCPMLRESRVGRDSRNLCQAFRTPGIRYHTLLTWRESNFASASMKDESRVIFAKFFLVNIGIMELGIGIMWTFTCHPIW